MPRNLKIGVVFGGPSRDHNVSMTTGRNVFKTLRDSGYDVNQVYVTPTGKWLVNDQPDPLEPIEICSRHDVMFNAMYGNFGEDGQVQQIFEQARVPYTGSGVAASSLAMNKIISREAFKRAGLLTPRYVALNRESLDFARDLPQVVQISAPPWVVKPASQGSSRGVSLVQYFEDLYRALEEAFLYDKNVIVEEFITGKEISCVVLDQYGGEQHMPLHPIEIIPASTNFHDMESKYKGLASETPVALFGEMLRKIKDTARAAHQTLGLRNYSKTDMIVKGTKVYVLEINTNPWLTQGSLVPKAAMISKIDYPSLLEHIVTQAI